MRALSMLILMIACLRIAVAAEQSESSLDRAARIDKFVEEGPQFIGKKTLSELRKLGVLKHEKVEKSPNSYIPGKIIEYRTLVFDGLEIYGDTPRPQKLVPIRVIVTDSKWPIQNGLSVGSPEARVIEALGKPNKIHNGSLEYCGETDRVYFFTVNGKVTKIEFSFYAD
jgi:hypothetical protein